MKNGRGWGRRLDIKGFGLGFAGLGVLQWGTFDRWSPSPWAALGRWEHGRTREPCSKMVSLMWKELSEIEEEQALDGWVLRACGGDSGRRSKV